MNVNFIRKNLHLIISIAVLIPAAFMYGIFPDKVLPLLLDIRVDAVDLKSIFRVIMCLYIGVAGLLITGLLREEYWNSATLLNTIFMGAMAMGRLLSMLVDGEPSMIFVLGMFGELILSVFSYLQYRIYGIR
jgi:hypothetical protein